MLFLRWLSFMIWILQFRIHPVVPMSHIQIMYHWQWHFNLLLMVKTMAMRVFSDWCQKRGIYKIGTSFYFYVTGCGVTNKITNLNFCGLICIVCVSNKQFVLFIWWTNTRCRKFVVLESGRAIFSIVMTNRPGNSFYPILVYKKNF